MQNADESAAEMGAVDPPGTVQQDSGGTSLESMILFKRRSTTVSSWGVLPETFIDTTATSSRPSTHSQVNPYLSRQQCMHFRTTGAVAGGDSATGVHCVSSSKVPSLLEMGSSSKVPSFLKMVSLPSLFYVHNTGAMSSFVFTLQRSCLHGGTCEKT